MNRLSKAEQEALAVQRMLIRAKARREAKVNEVARIEMEILQLEERQKTLPKTA
jgi:hypothetical protein